MFISFTFIIIVSIITIFLAIVSTIIMVSLIISAGYLETGSREEAATEAANR